MGAANGGQRAVTLDSRAAVFAMPARRRPKEQKRTGAEIAVAAGGKIPDTGERVLKFEFGDGGNGNMRFRLANATKPLRAVSGVRG